MSNIICDGAGKKYLCICLNYILLPAGAVQIYLNKSRATVLGSAFIRPSLFFCLESWRSTTDDCQFFQAQNWRTVPRAELAVGLRFNFACSGGREGWGDKHKCIQNFHRRLFWSVRRRLHWVSARAKGGLLESAHLFLEIGQKCFSYGKVLAFSVRCRS